MTDSTFTLDGAQLRVPMVVSSVRANDAAPDWLRWLTDIGCVPGEQVMLLRRGLLGGDPLVVRIGVSTFALRRAEASCVEVRFHAPA